MWKLKNITKSYTTGDFTQQAFVVEKVKVSEKFIDFTPFTNNSKFREVV